MDDSLSEHLYPENFPENKILAWALHSQYLTSDSVKDTDLDGELSSIQYEASEISYQLEPNPIDELIESKKFNRQSIVESLKKACRITRYGVEVGCVLAAVSPANESLRYLIFGWAHTVTNGNSLISSLSFGTSTFVIEAITALMAADLLDTRPGKSAIDKLNHYSKRFVKDDHSKTEIGLPARIATAMLFGSAVLTAAKYRKDSTRTKKVNQISGLKTAATMGLYFTAEEYAASEAINKYGWIKTIIGGAILIAAAQHGISKIVDNRTNKKFEEINSNE